MSTRTHVELGAVPETALWTLYHRAVEARRPDAVLRDPLAVELVERIDFPFAERFGGGELGQWQALRARTFDREIARFLRSNPGGTVVALGEGLETQFWRVDDGRVRWVTVDLPEIVEARRRLLPAADRTTAIARSVTDLAWIGELDASGPVLFTAQGLLMYLEPDDVRRLLGALGAWSVVFDTIPHWLVERSRAGKLRSPSTGYEPPPWHWGFDRAQLPGRRVERLRPPRGRGLVHGFLLPLAHATPGVRDLLLAVYRAASSSDGASTESADPVMRSPTTRP